MKTSLFALAALFFALATSRAQPAPQPDKSSDPVALPAQLGGLKVSIAPTYRNPNSPTIELHKGDPHINIVLQNVGDKPLSLYEEWNSWGAYNLTLEISAIDGKTLDEPLVISKGTMIWFANSPTTEMLEPGGVAVREVRLHLPKQIFDSTAPITKKQELAEKPLMGPLYGDFPFPPIDNSRALTLRAVFENSNPRNDGLQNAKSVWTGKIASPITPYRFSWNAR